MHLWWKANLRDKAYGLYQDLIAQPDCKNSKGQTKYIWKDEDPNTGLSFKLWKPE
jgi:hypothetical protein